MPEQSLKVVDQSKMTPAMVRQRMELNQQARFGLETASAEQLNVIYLISRRMNLDPLTDVTLSHGHVWFTVHGCLRIMRRHPEYAGFEQKPLGKDDKLIGGWAEDDIVWATTIRTKQWGSITQWGKVTHEEVIEGLAKKTPIGKHPVEMAQKRSAQHCIRAAFGYDAAPDEGELEQLIAEEIAARQNPEVVRRQATRYDEIFKPEDQDWRAQSGEGEPAAGSTGPTAGPSDTWAENSRLSVEAEALGIRAPVLRNDTPLDQVEVANQQLAGQIAERQMARR